jgi:O-antigen/teichoic acid export membrane protein
MHQRIHSNTIANIAGTLAAKFIDVLIISRIAPFLGKEGFGLFALAFDFVAMFAIFVDCGINTILIREIAADPRQGAQYLGQAIILKTILGLVTVALVNITALCIGYPPDVRRLVLIASGALLVSFRLPSVLTVFEPTFIAQLRLGRSRLCGILNQLVTLVGVLVGIRMGASLIHIVIIYVVLGVIPAIPFTILSWRCMAPKFARQWQQSGWLIRQGIPVAVTMICFTFISRLGVVILGRIGRTGDVGLYSAAGRLSGPLQLFSISAIYSLMPILSMGARQQKDHSELMAKSFTYLVSFQSLVAAGVAFSAPFLIRLIYGPEFTGSIVVLRMMCVGLPMVAAWQLISTLLIIEGKQHWASVLAVCALALCTALDLVLIPRMPFLVIAINRLIVVAALAFAAIAAMRVCIPASRVRPMLIVWAWGLVLIASIGEFSGTISVLRALLVVCMFPVPLLLSGLVSVGDIVLACRSLFKGSGQAE